MEAAMTSSHADVETIRRSMAQIRQNRHEHVREVLAGAELVAGWRRDASVFSWAALAAAAAVGLWVVIKHPKAGTMEKAKSAVPAIASSDLEKNVTDVGQRPDSRPGLLALVEDVLTTAALRAAQNYAAYCLEEWIARRRVAVARGFGHVRRANESAAIDRRPIRAKRGSASSDELNEALVVGGSSDD
jgi:hypothetical protein